MMIYKSTFVMAILVMCASFAVARADVEYTIATKYIFTKSAYGPANSSEETNTNFVTAKKSRREIVRSYDIYLSKEVLIFRCDLHQSFRVDDSLKIYTVSNMVPPYSSPASESELKEDIPEMTTTTNYAIKKLAPEKVNGFDTQCYEVTTTTQYSGDRANNEGKSTMKWWLADVPGWQSCNEINAMMPASFTRIVPAHQGIDRRRYTEKYTGDFEEMNKLRTQFPVRIEGTSENFSKASNEATIDQNVTSFSTEKLDDSLFEVPNDYRKVTSEEYQKLRSKAEIDAIGKSKKAKTQQ